jgi:hypothetical protein
VSQLHVHRPAAITQAKPACGHVDNGLAVIHPKGSGFSLVRVQVMH